MKNSRRSAFLYVRVSPLEGQLAERLAEAEGLSISEVFRFLLHRRADELQLRAVECHQEAKPLGGGKGAVYDSSRHQDRSA